MKRYTRRNFIKWSAAGLGAVVVSTGLQGCSSDSSSDSDNDTETNINVSFDHGVASGDPLTDKVIIWTRVVPESETSVQVSWEVATDPEFLNVTHNGSTETDISRDYTVKVDVQNLEAGATYYYRFSSNGVTSVIGRTKTLPEGSVDQVKLAVFSCANYPAGYFHVYGEAAKRDDLDAVLHLGDYIYEYGQGGYATEDAEALGRTLAEDNQSETISLDDYRKRYALYRTDPQLQQLHAKVPFIVVWDDHEITNDTWRGGAENHHDEEGDFFERKRQALQAYFEWLPIRPVVENSHEEIYRRFDFGDLVSLHMLDTRVIGRDQQLDYANYFSPDTGFNGAQFVADLTAPSRTLLGAEQLGWLQNGLAESESKWQVLGQQILMGRMLLPNELLVQLGGNPSEALSSFQELATIKARILQGDPTVTDEESQRLENPMPYNLDAWDGYAYEREVIFNSVRELDKNLVVLAGDTHNAWANNLKDNEGNSVGVEFATASVTSPGLETYLSLPPGVEVAQQAELGLTTLIDDLHYLNINQRGYMVVTFTSEESRAEWLFVSTIKSQEYVLDEGRSFTMATKPGSENRDLEA